MATDSISIGDHGCGPQLRVTSFGFGHGAAPAADIVLDLRPWFRDPHVSPRLRELTGRDPEIIANVLSTPGVGGFINQVFHAAGELVQLGLGTVNLAAGCVGGRHRSAVVSDQLYFRALSAGWTAEVVHRDADKPVLTGRRTRPVDLAH
jgi:RNase adaptor protein for sRNA GlmZ degradation